MTTAAAIHATVVIPNAVSSVQDIPLSRIQESKTNPRRQFDESRLSELAHNIRLHGILQPILVRPLPGGDADSYELVAGARRYRASQLAKCESIPATIRELTDTQCLELQLIENLQRADVHELDEARGYAALMQMQPETYTVEVLAEKIGRSEKYVYARLRLAHLIEDVQQAFYNAKLSVAHAFEIARLQPSDQQRALQECFPNHRTTAAILRDGKSEAVTVRQLRAWVEREIHLDLTNAPFDPQGESLLPAAGSCAKCPKRTGNNPLLFPEVRQKSICTDRACYRGKVEALVQIRVRTFQAAGEKPLRVAHAPAWQTKDRNPDVLYEGQYRLAHKKAECPHTQPAVVIDGPDAGKLLRVCRDEQCPVHARVTRYQPSPQERAARAKEALAERIERQTRIRTLNAIRQKLSGTLSRLDLEMAALDYFERLGHDNQRRLCRVYGWEEKKTKGSWGGSTVDYQIIAGKAVREMSAPEIYQFLVVCALVADLYCPGFLGLTSEISSRRDARVLLQSRLATLNSGQRRVQSTMSFGAFVANHFEPVVLPTLKPATQEIYSFLLRKHLLPRFTECRLCDITRAEVQPFLTGKLKNGYAWETTHHLRSLLSKIIGTAVDWNYLSDNPVRGAKMPERSLKRPHRFLSLEEVRRLLAASEEPVRTIVLLAVMTGLRIGEILALRWGRINLAVGTLRVEETCYKGTFGTPKTRASRREVPLTPGVIQALQAHRVNCRDTADGALVFATRLGTPLASNNLRRRQLHPASQQAGLGSIDWHSLRHTHGTLLHEQGTPLRVAQAQLGHSHMTTTLDIYTHASGTAQRQAVDHLESLLFPSVPKFAELGQRPN